MGRLGSNSIKQMSRTVVVRIDPGSDGDASHQPNPSTHRLVNPPTIYLEKIAQLWMERRGETKSGVTFVLDRLPMGYTLWEKPRLNNPKHVDKWLFGHPSHKYFDSPNRFFPHFLYLMETSGNSVGCPCAVCTDSKTIVKPAAGKVSQAPIPGPATSEYFQKQRGRKPKLALGPTSKVDDEGTPDVYRNLIDALKVRGTLDQTIQEKLSMDWRAERLLVPNLHAGTTSPAWLPRVGEIILFVRSLNHGEQLRYDPDKKRFWVYDAPKAQFTRSIKWEAGIVAQAAHEDCTIEELVQEKQNQEYNVNYSGFRVEPIPGLNDKDKSISTRRAYVHLHQIRPFGFWKELLQHTPENDLHPTILNTQSLMSTFSLVEKYRFKGTWPSASVHCEGIYLGSELILKGDVIRIARPEIEDEVTDVLQVKFIELYLSGLDQASDNDYDDGHPYNSTVYILGTAYTQKEIDDNHNDSDQDVEMDVTNLPTQLRSSGNWRPKYEPGKGLKISFNRVLGRYYEDEAMRLWFKDYEASDSLLLSAGLEGTVEARHHSRKVDHRIQHGKKWYWAESRTDALDLATFNGQEVAKFDEDRDPREWRKFIKVIEGVAGDQERLAVKQKVSAQRTLRNFGMFQYKPPQDSETDPESGQQSRKRSHFLMTSSSGAAQRLNGGGLEQDFDEDDDAMNGVSESEVQVNPVAKKQRVSVVIESPRKT